MEFKFDRSKLTTCHQDPRTGEDTRQIKRLREERKEIAQWIIDHIFRYGKLLQIDAANHIRSKYGVEHLEKSSEHSYRLAPTLLKVLRKHELYGSVKWSQGDKCWHLKMPSEE